VLVVCTHDVFIQLSDIYFLRSRIFCRRLQLDFSGYVQYFRLSSMFCDDSKHFLGSYSFVRSLTDAL